MESNEATFNAIIDQLPQLLYQLKNCEDCHRRDHRLRDVPGIYVFWEGEQALYVGRTNTLRSRVLYHSRRSSGHNSATFAFLLAREKAPDTITGTRVALEKHPVFSSLFFKAKERVAAMTVRFVEVSDPRTQAILEIYAASVLATPYNDFDNH
jgi:hypothetical protein